MKKRVSFTLSQEVLAGISQEAKKLGLSRSAVVQLVMDAWLKRGKPPVSLEI